MFSKFDLVGLRNNNETISIHRYIHSLYSKHGYEETLDYVRSNYVNFDLGTAHINYLQDLININDLLKVYRDGLDKIVFDNNWYDELNNWIEIMMNDFSFMEIYILLMQYFTLIQYQNYDEGIIDRITDFLELMTKQEQYDYQKQRFW